MSASKIEWTDRSDWNPIRGCTRVSPGCGGPGKHGGCYAEKIAARFSGPGQPFDGFAEMRNGEARWTGKVALIEDRLTAPLHWRKPARIFACSMSDLFHEAMDIRWIDSVFDVMRRCPQHTFQVLTKRAAIMRDYARVWQKAPLPNVWLGISAERQPEWDERTSELRQTPAAIRFVSAEPLLGHIETGHVDGGLHGIHWVIVGGESGPRARPCHPDWVRSLRDQCQAAEVPFFFKQWGEWLPGQNDPHPNQQWGIAHWQDGGWGERDTPNPSRNYVMWEPDGTMHYGGTRSGKNYFKVARWAARVGKKAAGAMLDGREWREFPSINGGTP